MNKQTRDAIVLAVLVVLLIGAAVYAFKSSSPTPKAPVKSASAADSDAPTATVTPGGAPGAATPKPPADPGKLDWVDDVRVPGLVAEVAGGRNPFIDYLGLEAERVAAQEKAREEARRNSPIPTNLDSGLAALGTTGQIKPLPILPPRSSVVRPLAWVSYAVARATLQEAKVEVKIAPGRAADEIKVSGYEPEFSKAIDVLNRLDVEPPVPTFVLSGVVITPTERYVGLTMDGKYYTLVEGEAIPQQGWTVTNITRVNVTLVKGKQVVKLRLSGGSPS